jgi:hypothetical protein
MVAAGMSLRSDSCKRPPSVADSNRADDER